MKWCFPITFFIYQWRRHLEGGKGKSNFKAIQKPVSRHLLMVNSQPVKYSFKPNKTCQLILIGSCAVKLDTIRFMAYPNWVYLDFKVYNKKTLSVRKSALKVCLILLECWMKLRIFVVENKWKVAIIRAKKFAFPS